MSALIKGMKMPKACSDCFAERCIGSDFGCDILGFDDANTTCFTKERREDCPLIELPPHGRCIDADKLMEEMRLFIKENMLSCDDARELIETIADAPTVIPAEEVET